MPEAPRSNRPSPRTSAAIEAELRRRVRAELTQARSESETGELDDAALAGIIARAVAAGLGWHLEAPEHTRNATLSSRSWRPASGPRGGGGGRPEREFDRPRESDRPPREFDRGPRPYERDFERPPRDYDRPPRDFDRPPRDYDRPPRDYDRPPRDFDGRTPRGGGSKRSGGFKRGGGGFAPRRPPRSR